MSVSFTHTTTEVTAVRQAVDLWAVDSVDAAQLAAVKIAARWQSEGATAADIARLLTGDGRTYTVRQVDQPLALMVRLAALVKSDEDVTGVTACGVLLSGRGTGRSVNGPAKVLKDWTKAGRTFTSWEAARKALAALVKAAPAKAATVKAASTSTPEAVKGAAAAPEAAKAETLESAAARLSAELLATAGRLGVTPQALLAAVATATRDRMAATAGKPAVGAAAPVKAAPAKVTATPATAGKAAPVKAATAA